MLFSLVGVSLMIIAHVWSLRITDKTSTHFTEVDGLPETNLDDLAGLIKAYSSSKVGKTSKVWTHNYVTPYINMSAIRSGTHNVYVWQTEGESMLQKWTDLLFSSGGKWYFDRTFEDGAEGVFAVNVTSASGEKILVSRDLLDSVAEMIFLEQTVLQRDEIATVIDIGAGYGRLARRMTEALPNINYYATDGVPESTYICHKYLTKHQSRARVVPLTQVEDLVTSQPKLAINIHSFSEQTKVDVTFWVELMARAKTPYFMVVPNAFNVKEKVMKFNDGSEMNSIFNSAGYHLKTVERGVIGSYTFLWTL